MGQVLPNLHPGCCQGKTSMSLGYDCHASLPVVGTNEPWRGRRGYPFDSLKVEIRECFQFLFPSPSDPGVVRPRQLSRVGVTPSKKCHDSYGRLDAKDVLFRDRTVIVPTQVNNPNVFCNFSGQLT